MIPFYKMTQCYAWLNTIFYSGLGNFKAISLIKANVSAVSNVIKRFNVLGSTFMNVKNCYKKNRGYSG